MTQKEFIDTKIWLEKVTNLTFSDDEAILAADGVATFENAIDVDTRAEIAFNDEDCAVYLYDNNAEWGVIEICKQSRYNAHLCTEVFAHIIHHNR